jgi:hypothetical protein
MSYFAKDSIAAIATGRSNSALTTSVSLSNSGTSSPDAALDADAPFEISRQPMRAAAARV